MHMTSLFNSSRSRLLIAVAALVYLLSQSLDLLHSHDGDLNLQADCQICLKLGSQSDAAIAQVAIVPLQTGHSEYQAFLPGPSVRPVLKSHSRAPPLFG